MASGGRCSWVLCRAEPSGSNFSANTFHQASLAMLAARSGNDPMKVSLTLRFSVDWSGRTRGV